ncbi:hypothetical protein AHMF7616_00897 [Adhaeribacter pallidiroseus]|uniref:Uncharacterized protein n=1 Tax=Adhaeribacter pallidiroseus TaxID=2072847 RepID=A0A369QC73_9BACT|nr:hypothetical protein AHMF7616_00897 [Adhaeribacter pallidiroseus]
MLELKLKGLEGLSPEFLPFNRTMLELKYA